jgi:predicted dehydrogenase
MASTQATKPEGSTMRRIDRRRFIKTSIEGAAGLAAAGAAAAAAPLAYGRALGASERVRVAVVGVRGRGRKHAESYAELDGVEVAALADVDLRVVPELAELVAARQKKRPEVVQDFRKLLDDKSIDAVSIATPDHWHALATILSCQATKDVYVEKPCSHNIREGRLMVEAARKYRRVIQHGTQSRSGETFLKAREFLQSGKLGRILVAKVVNSQLRANIGKAQDGAAPAEVDYDLWLGPAPKRPFNPNRFHYNWHWHWDYGTGDIGNDGVHALDYARWLLGVADPLAVSASGAKLHFDDDQETPDTQVVTFEFAGAHLVYEMRIWTPYHEHGMENGAVFYGEEGCMELGPHGFRVVFRGDEPGPSERGGARGERHFQNFIDCVRSRATPNADILEGHLSSRLAHLGNIATRVGRRLRFDAAAERIADDPQANALLRREYRKGFEVPDPV